MNNDYGLCDVCQIPLQANTFIDKEFYSMKCTYCGEETDVQYRLDDTTPAFQGMCRHCALYWGETATVCHDCRKGLGCTVYELRGHYYCESCFLREAEITEGE